MESGNFADQRATQHLCDVCGPLLMEVREAMKTPSALRPDAWYGTLVPANLEIVACLLENLGGSDEARSECREVLPAPETVANWRRRYMNVWDRHIDRTLPDASHKEQRRAVLLGTFRRIERLSAMSHSLPANV